MTPERDLQAGTRRSPVAECRLCSVVCILDAPTTDALRQNLRAFMAEHRHGGLADIVIDISDEDEETDGDDPDVVSAPRAVGLN